MPDYSKLPEFNYKNVFLISHNNDDGSSKTVDDFLPRANIVQKFEKGLLSLENEEATGKLKVYCRTNIHKRIAPTSAEFEAFKRE